MPADCAVAAMSRRQWAASSSGKSACLASRRCAVRVRGGPRSGIEEDGNLPDSDSGETRFDSGGPDLRVVAQQVALMLGEHEARRFESVQPDRDVV